MGADTDHATHLDRVRRRFPDVEFVELSMSGPVDNMPDLPARDLFLLELVGDRVLARWRQRQGAVVLRNTTPIMRQLPGEE